MGIEYFVKAAVSEYQDKDGTTKKRYQTVGIVTRTKKNDLMIKLEMIPLLGLKEGAFWGYLNVPEEKSDSPKVTISDSDIPF